MISRVVLDTNILVAAARSRLGASYVILQQVREGKIRPLISVPLILEYEAVLCRTEQLHASGRSIAQTLHFLDALVMLAEPVSLHFLWRPQLRDASDEMVLETALNGQADALVTLNVQDFQVRNFQLNVLTPGLFLRQLQLE